MSRPDDDVGELKRGLIAGRGPKPTKAPPSTELDILGANARVAGDRDRWHERAVAAEAEVQRLTQRYRESEDDNAELRVSHGSIQATNQWVNEKLKAADAEVQRLREALERIRDMTPPMSVERAKAIAAAALDREGEPT